jgi:hypothetical protein
MEPSDWISIVAIVSGALISVVSLWFGNIERSRDRQQARADDRTERAIAAYSSTRLLLDLMTPRFDFAKLGNPGEIATPPKKLRELDRELYGRVVGELEWLSMMGWTEGIRDKGDQIQTGLLGARWTHGILFREQEGGRKKPTRRGVERETLETLEEKIKSLSASVDELRAEIRAAIM